MRARLLVPNVGVIASMMIDTAKLPRPLGPVDRVVLVIDDPEAKGPDRTPLMLEGQLERVR